MKMDPERLDMVHINDGIEETVNTKPKNTIHAEDLLNSLETFERRARGWRK